MLAHEVCTRQTLHALVQASNLGQRTRCGSLQDHTVLAVLSVAP